MDQKEMMERLKRETDLFVSNSASAISGMLQGIMSTPQGAALVQRIGESLQK